MTRDQHPKCKNCCDQLLILEHCLLEVVNRENNFEVSRIIDVHQFLEYINKLHNSKNPNKLIINI